MSRDNEDCVKYKLHDLLRNQKWDEAVLRATEKKKVSRNFGSPKLNHAQRGHRNELELAIRDEFQMLPLHIACYEKAPLKVIKALVENYTAAVKTRWICGQDELPLHLLCDSETRNDGERKLLDADSIEYLIDKYPAALLEKKRDDHVTPLHLLCQEFRYNVADHMLRIIRKVLRTTPKACKVKGGVDDGRDTQRMEQLPLHMAVIHTEFECVEMIYNSYNDGIKVPDTSGSLPIHWCVQVGCSEKVLSFLLNKYPDSISYKNQEGNRPLHLLLHVDNCIENYLDDGLPKNHYRSSIYILLGSLLRFAINEKKNMKRLLDATNNDGKNVIEIARDCQLLIGGSFNVSNILIELYESGVSSRLWNSPFINEEERNYTSQKSSEGSEYSACSGSHGSDFCSAGGASHSLPDANSDFFSADSDNTEHIEGVKLSIGNSTGTGTFSELSKKPSKRRDIHGNMSSSIKKGLKIPRKDVINLEDSDKESDDSTGDEVCVLSDVGATLMKEDNSPDSNLITNKLRYNARLQKRAIELEMSLQHIQKSVSRKRAIAEVVVQPPKRRKKSRDNIDHRYIEYVLDSDLDTYDVDV